MTTVPSTTQQDSWWDASRPTRVLDGEERQRIERQRALTESRSHKTKGRSSPQDWVAHLNLRRTVVLRGEGWLAERVRYALAAMRDSTEIDPEVRGGVPVLKGTRMPISRILGEIADDCTVSEIAENFEQDAKTIRLFLEGIALYLDRSFSE